MLSHHCYLRTSVSMGQRPRNHNYPKKASSSYGGRVRATLVPKGHMHIRTGMALVSEQVEGGKRRPGPALEQHIPPAGVRWHQAGLEGGCHSTAIPHGACSEEHLHQAVPLLEAQGAPGPAPSHTGGPQPASPQCRNPTLSDWTRCCRVAAPGSKPYVQKLGHAGAAAPARPPFTSVSSGAYV